MIDRYIHEVLKRLPDKLRGETERDLRELIQKKMTELDPALSEEARIDLVLRELGDPAGQADHYRGRQRFLIGPAYFDKYLMVLKIVSGAIFLGISIATMIRLIFAPQTMGLMVADYLSAVFSAVLQGAAWVTGIFALLEYNEVSLNEAENKSVFDPAKLPDLPEKKALIPKSEPIVALILTAVFVPLLYVSAEKLGVYQSLKPATGFTPLLSDQGLAPFKNMLLAVFALNILIELMKLVKGRWTLPLALVTSALNIVSALIIVFTITRMSLYHPELLLNFERYVPFSFQRLIAGITAVILIVTLAESATAIYKGSRYGRVR
ncbi:hypothetical protein [Proteiniclasticum sp. QWL-01]|uniref:hypothetical protein n=1 Tax=Proteiniclasticum sp. QWL-01 TaxID=3036945 RepID=UPI00220DB5E5|nr:hypothetical protein [Proteiniclasticum sp. QWL-01]UUM11231.1 hypothetical protein NQU17_11300 [Clostridiaceae bacterium HFYG-1003]WFF72569.1 hypothetical protein P6M73_15040 [Proteiniclasticum sp. QWL-01]